MTMSRAALFRSPENAQTPLRVSLGLADSGNDISMDGIAEAVRTISRLWPLIILSKFCLGAMAFEQDSNALHAYAMALLPMLLCDLAICFLPRTRLMVRHMPHRHMWILMGMVALSGVTTALWAAHMPPNILFSIDPVRAQLALAILAACLFGKQRILSLAYCSGGAIGSLATGSVEHLPAVIFLLCVLSLATFMLARIDHDLLAASHAAKMRGHRSELMLREYEEAGRGWFWETDRTGIITYISETLASSLGLTQAKLVGRPITDLIAVGDRLNRDGDRTLGFHMSARTSFSELAVRVALGDGERWWSISGRPIISEFGQYHGFRGSGTDLTEMRRTQAEVSRLAKYDSLTGLANRVQMNRALEQALVDSAGRKGECTLFLLDLDRFKSVNDTLGHPAGDALLREVSKRLQQVVGTRGTVGRLGGDEFKVVLPGLIDRRNLAMLADAIISSLSEPYVIEGTTVVIGASVGIALSPDDGVTPDALVRNADLALYSAKDNGRGVYRFYSADMHADAEDRRQLEEDLRAALSSDGLRVVYQPVVSAVTEQISGFEALLRWTHPVRGEISPALFIPIAEDTGLISQIGEWVLRTACNDAAQWPAAVRVAVNVSPIQFANPSLPGVVMNALATAGLSPERLELEITEGVFLNDDANTDTRFAQLKKIGVRLALDDFGTGYSSLGYLKKAPFDKIKIDQGFVRGATQPGNRNGAIIKSIVSLAEALNMDTTAEGVETHDELDLIRALGCSHIQGFIYGKGITAAEVLSKFKNQGESAEANGFQSSRMPRKSVLRSVSISHSGHSYTGRIRNLSPFGAMIEGLWNVPKDTIFTIELAQDYSVDAIVRWSSQDRAGVQFAEEINMARLNGPSTVRMAS